MSGGEGKGGGGTLDQVQTTFLRICDKDFRTELGINAVNSAHNTAAEAAHCNLGEEYQHLPLKDLMWIDV